MQSQIESQIQALVAEKIESEQTQKTNLEEKSEHRHHVSKASIHYQLPLTNCITSFCLRTFNILQLTLYNKYKADLSLQQRNHLALL